MTALVGIGLDVVTGATWGLVIARVCGAVFMAPFIAIGSAWAARWTVALRDRPGEPLSVHGVPRLLLAYAAPMALLLAASPVVV